MKLTAFLLVGLVSLLVTGCLDKPSPINTPQTVDSQERYESQRNLCESSALEQGYDYSFSSSGCMLLEDVNGAYGEELN